MIHSGDHEFKDGTAIDRCVHCGTIYQHHLNAPQPCVPHRTSSEKIMPEPSRRVYAVDDFDTIGKRLDELREEKAAKPPEYV